MTPFDWALFLGGIGAVLTGVYLWACADERAQQRRDRELMRVWYAHTQHQDRVPDDIAAHDEPTQPHTPRSR